MLKICPNGHEFEKSSDCPVCPICEKQKAVNLDFARLSAPARRALANAGIAKLKDLSRWTEVDLLRLHGLGPSAIPVLRAALKKAKLSLKKPAAKAKK
jgi:DNA-directed RNA polymerase alpha subunit